MAERVFVLGVDLDGVCGDYTTSFRAVVAEDRGVDPAVLGDARSWDFAGPGEPLADALPNAELVTLRNVDHFATPKDFGCIDAALDFLGAAP